MLPFCSLVLTPTSELHDWCTISILESSDSCVCVTTRFGHIEKDRRGCSVGVGNTLASHESELGRSVQFAKECASTEFTLRAMGLVHTSRSCGRGARNCFRYPYLLHFQPMNEPSFSYALITPQKPYFFFGGSLASVMPDGNIGLVCVGNTYEQEQQHRRK